MGLSGQLSGAVRAEAPETQGMPSPRVLSCGLPGTEEGGEPKSGPAGRLLRGSDALTDAALAPGAAPCLLARTRTLFTLTCQCFPLKTSEAFSFLRDVFNTAVSNKNLAWRHMLSCNQTGFSGKTVTKS